MKRTKQLVFTLAGFVLLGMARPCRATIVSTFSGDFAPSNWTVSGSGGAATAFTSQNLDITAPASSSPFAYSISITPSATVSYTLSVLWNLAYNGDTGSPTAYYEVESGTTLVSGGPGNPLTGNGNSGYINNISIPAGDTLVFDFIGGGTAAGKSPATFDLLDVVPEAGTWQAGIFILGFIVVALVRRKLATPAQIGKKS